MKPPARTRSAPVRYEESGCRARASPCSAWTPREKALLLKALKLQRQQKELDFKALQELLPQKSHTEVVAFIHLLKGRVAREAVQKEYRRCQEEKRIRESKVLAPIEVWTDLSEKVSHNLEEAITTAFSQILTIAATEPISLLHSVPRKSTKTAGKKIINSSAESRQSDSSSPASHNIPESATGTHEATPVGVMGTSQSQEDAPATAEGESTSPGLEEFNVDFEKIYKYLSALTQDGKPPELSSFESAVILDLLTSLPDELVQLDCAGLRTHMYQSFNQLSSPWPGQEEPAGTVLPAAPPQELCPIPEALLKSTEQGRDCPPAREKQNGATTCTQNTTLRDKGPRWKELSVCPLNSFLIPIKLLSQTVKN